MPVDQRTRATSSFASQTSPDPRRRIEWTTTPRLQALALGLQGQRQSHHARLKPKHLSLSAASGAHQRGHKASVGSPSSSGLCNPAQGNVLPRNGTQTSGPNADHDIVANHKAVLVPPAMPVLLDLQTVQAMTLQMQDLSDMQRQLQADLAHLQQKMPNVAGGTSPWASGLVQQVHTPDADGGSTFANKQPPRHNPQDDVLGVRPAETTRTQVAGQPARM